MLLWQIFTDLPGFASCNNNWLNYKTIIGNKTVA
jgi:hypothetical protein